MPHKKGKRTRGRPSAHTSWDPVARWYQQWAGSRGSVYHLRLAVPAVLRLLQPKTNETVLDIGCGTGVLSRYLPPGVRYIGVDASPRLIAFARRNYGSRKFIQGDARDLAEVKGLEPGMAEAAVFQLSIQDMHPLDEVLSSAAWALRPEGRIVILMMHPCFRVPRQSGWGWDEGRKLQFRRIDSYLSRRSVPVRPIAKGEPGSIQSFHRPLSTYVNSLNRQGFYVERMEEIPAYPAVVRRGARAKGENKANSEIPLFLGLLARSGKGLHADSRDRTRSRRSGLAGGFNYERGAFP